MQEVGPSPQTVPPHTRRAGALVLGLSLMTIGALTLFPAPIGAGLPAFCIICGQFGGVDFLLNVALFAPLGLGARLMSGRLRVAVLVGLAATLVVESLQWRVIAGRDASLGDLLANTLGAGLGGYMAIGLPALWRLTGQRAVPWTIGFGTLAAALLVFSGFVVAPAPTAERQFVLWSGLRPGFDPLPATLQRAVVNGRRTAGGDLLPSRFFFRGAELNTTVEVNLTGPGGITRRKAHILSAAFRAEEALLLAQWRDAVVFRTNTNGGLLRLRPVMAKLDNALGPTTGRDLVVTVTAHSSRKGVHLQSDRGDAHDWALLPRTAGLAWTSLLPWDLAVDTRWWPANALYLSVLLVPVGFLAARAAQVRGRYSWLPGGLALLLTAGALLVTPLLTGIAASGWGEWFGAAAGAGVGFLIGRNTARPIP